MRGDLTREENIRGEIEEMSFSIIKEKEAIKVQTIKDRMIERAPNATRLMDKLCEKNLIDRERCEDDRRVVYISITQQGKKLLKTIDDKLHLDFIDNLTEEEATQLSGLLDKIRQ